MSSPASQHDSDEMPEPLDLESMVSKDSQDLLRELGDRRHRIAELTSRTRTSSSEEISRHENACKEESARHTNAVHRNASRHTRTKEAIREKYRENHEDAMRTCDFEIKKIDQDAREMKDRIQTKSTSNARTAKTAMEEAAWVAETVYEANEDRPRKEFEELRAQMEATQQELNNLDKVIGSEIRRYWQSRPRVTPPTSSELEKHSSRPDKTAILQLASLTKSVEYLRKLPISRVFRGPTLILPAILFAGIGIGSIHLMTSMDGGEMIAYGVATGIGIFLPIAAVFYVLARREVTKAYTPISHSIHVIRHTTDLAIEQGARGRSEMEARLIKDRDRDIQKSKDKFEPLIEESRIKAEKRLDEVERRVPVLKEHADNKREKRIHAVEEWLKKANLQNEHAFRDAVAHEEGEHQRILSENDANHTQSWKDIEETWKRILSEDTHRIREISGNLSSAFIDWQDPDWKAWKPSKAPPPAVPVGTITFDRTKVDGGLPEDSRLASDLPQVIEIPGIIALPNRASLEIDVDTAHRDQGVEILRALMLRILSSVPAGKAKFTIIDPVGLGQNFAGFMHLEDEFQGLIGERIWTETRHIEQKLLDITEHMETVIQKYLRNEFESIDAYNAEAGEIAEPYRFLVIADFPANFHEESARRLASILSSGPRCGVFTLILRDRRLPVPERFDLEDISRHAVSIRSVDGELIFEDENLGHLPFTPASGPPDDLLIEVSRKVGKAAAEAGRVEVPFQTIAPKLDQLWTASSEDKLKVALGRAGATKLQTLTLGVGTSQHALIAGKTGSGKSTLLHALITNLAAWYSPDEVEFYLVDFKKGVEFKTYATHGLPHARAVAVESDREFGLSVLQGLDDELRRRGELFRGAGTQDLGQWRKRSDEPMPRVLLVIDEFQELFVEDDKVSQDAGLLLDRLVRQGRAFGMHVLLGSQTLGGAYSLHRSTMGQMGVRIALQCNEQDSMLILSDDNVAARLLSRPGEAIYNDQSGLMEGNSPFQVCWLPDEVREEYLTRISEKAKEDFPDHARRCIVFEGNAPASLATNMPLRTQLARRPQDVPASFPLWLGDAVAIKDPTNALMRRQAGGNLVILGQQDENALATTTGAILSAASAHPSDKCRFVILDGTPADDQNAGYLHRVANILPHDSQTPSFRESSDAVLEIGKELAQRIENESTDAPPLILVVHGLQRFRALRRADDDFGFSMDDDAPLTADKVFGQILKEGPEYGIFIITWCDTVPSLERAVDRLGMRGFDNRALFQVSATDSSTIIDSPIAAQLGQQRGLLYSEERGTIEKFRPWALPSESLLAQIGQALSR